VRPLSLSQEETVTSLIYQVPRASVAFTNPEIELLMACSAAHYDWLCKAAGKPGPDGFLWGLHWNGKGDLWSREVDLLLKILEQAALLYADDPIKLRAAIALRAELVKLFHTFADKEEPLAQNPRSASGRR
jgi:hypothetical protein